jgi:hypothetical protein
MKPLGRKNYGSIGHLPNSRMGPADHSVHEGQGRICTVKTRDKHDIIHVTEKLDGSNVGIAKSNGKILALGRAGHLAQSSKYEQHQLFAAWVRDREDTFFNMLSEGERLVGEWMAQAHGTLYTLPRGPFAAFDLMIENRRQPFDELMSRCKLFDVPMPKLVHSGDAISVEEAMKLHGPGDHGADEPEGVVYRVERNGKFDFMAKWVRPDKIDGKYLPELAGSLTTESIWNWKYQKMK